MLTCLGMPLAARVLALAPRGLGLPGRAASRSFATAITSVLKENIVTARSLAWLCQGIDVIRTWEMLRGTSGRANRMLLLRDRTSDTSLLLHHTDHVLTLVPQVYHLKHQGVWYTDYFFLSNGLHLPLPAVRHWLHLADTSRTDAWLRAFREQPHTTRSNFWSRLRWRLGAPWWRVTFAAESFNAFTSIGGWTVRPARNGAGTGIVLTSAVANIVLLADELLIIPCVLALRSGGLCVPNDAAIRALDIERCQAWNAQTEGT